LEQNRPASRGIIAFQAHRGPRTLQAGPMLDLASGEPHALKAVAEVFVLRTNLLNDD
jgi:hypothetical protein